MIIIIDGYNVLKKVHSASGQTTEAQRNAFITAVSRYGDMKNHKTYIVFDAGPSNYSMRCHQRETTIVYSGTHATADDMIEQLACSYKNREVLVVTEDRELQTRVKRFNADCIAPLLFYEKIKEIQKQKSQEYIKHQRATLVKISNDINNELDFYFQSLSDQGKLQPLSQKMDDYLEDVTIKNRQTPSNPLSKKEKHQQRKLRKL